jgi:hypothetical protein
MGTQLELDNYEQLVQAVFPDRYAIATRTLEHHEEEDSMTRAKTVESPPSPVQAPVTPTTTTSTPAVTTTPALVNEPQPAKRFDPQSRLIKVKGGQLYLQVRDRLIWLRQEHPEARIETSLLDYVPSEKMFIVHARIEITVFDSATGNPVQAVASGIAQETDADFSGNACEKAETKAIGRALGSLGYGTSFALEFDEGDRFAEAPVTPRPSSSPTDPTDIAALRAEVESLLAQAPALAKKLTDSGRPGPDKQDATQLTLTRDWLRRKIIEGSSGS